jgi:hypothetical protein
VALAARTFVKEAAADALYEYDVVIINPESYSHFIFGVAGAYSDSPKELWDLKRKSDDLDLDSVFYSHEREKELNTAIKGGSRVVWLMVPDKRIGFFGMRSLYNGYASSIARDVAYNASIVAKRARKLSLKDSSARFSAYFRQLMQDGWRVCGSFAEEEGYVSLATTPDDYSLGLEIRIEQSRAWLLTPPTSSSALIELITAALQSKANDKIDVRHHGIFLCHSSEDKGFVRKLRRSLEQNGVDKVWVDEGELLIGDSLLKKIDQGITLTKYFGVVLSPRSVRSNWVRRELEIAMNREIESDQVVVLPLLYEPCDIPSFLRTKLYGDFTSPSLYRDSLRKLLRRLAV